MAHITVVGSGVVGQATGKGFIAQGHTVQFVDISPKIVENLRSEGYHAFYPHEVIWAAADLTLLSVNTPTVDGRIVLTHLFRAIETLAVGLANTSAYHTVVVRSTVPPTTTRDVIKPMLELYSGKVVGQDLGLCMNPEFLRQVSAERDFLNPWLTVVGTTGPLEAELMWEIYEPFGAPIVLTDCTTAETIKYANNLYNATKISFFNEFHLVCERIDADCDTVASTVARSAEGMWNPAYGTRAGWAYGGACLPKDTAAFFEFAQEIGVETPVLAGTMRINEIMERRSGAPASMQEVVPVEVLAAEALAMASHAASVAGSSVVDPDGVPTTIDFSASTLAAESTEISAAAD